MRWFQNALKSDMSDKMIHCSLHSKINWNSIASFANENNYYIHTEWEKGRKTDRSRDIDIYINTHTQKQIN